MLKANYTEVNSSAPPAATHTFRVKAPLLAKGQTLCLLGDGAALGNWCQARPILLNRIAGEDYLSVQLDLRGQPFPLAYKYGVFDVEKNSFLRFEDGANRVLHDAIAPGKHTVVNDGFARVAGEHRGRARAWRFRFSVCAAKTVLASANFWI